MADYVAKKGDLLSDLQVRLVDRTGANLDLTNATSVLMYMRPSGGAVNKLNGASCSMQSPLTGGVIIGPSDPTATDTTGDYAVYWKVMYGTTPKRVPSDGFFWIRVGDNFE